jgi:Zn-dependent M28 family amino/carboxypeptidase
MAIQMLKELTDIGHRFSASQGYEDAVAWSEKKMKDLGFDRVWREPVMIPKWVRGTKEEAFAFPSTRQEQIPLAVTALGRSIGTPEGGIRAEVVEVTSFEQLREMGDAAEGKIVFFNRPMDRTRMNTFRAYGGAVGQRSRGAIEAAKAGGVFALVRSMSTSINPFPHTGGMRYADSIPKVPSAAISTLDAELLSDLLQSDPRTTVRIALSARTLPDVESSNVLGEIRGSEFPDEIIVIGGHLDSWDKGQGAHDDASGCVQSIEAVRILKELGLKPKRTIRAVMFANEENGLRGGRAYAEVKRGNERHIAAMESDAGGFAPRGFGIGDSAAYEIIKQWAPVFSYINADKIVSGGGGADISPLGRQGVPTIGLNVENHRYFEYHHSDADTFDKVNERELALGAAAMATLAYLISEHGL